MKMDIAVAEIVDLINEIRHQPKNLYEMIRKNVQETVGQYLTALMYAEMIHFLGRDR